MIRSYTASDTDDVLDIWYQASLVAHPFLDEDFLEKERHNIRSIYLPNTETWIYESDGRAVGFIALMGNEVGAIFVRPDWHGKGIGRKLMDVAAGRHESLEVEVFERNSIGCSFYMKYGFVELSRSIHAESGFELIRMKFTG